MTRDRIELLGVPLSPTSYDAATALILDWARRHEPGFVCAANVHMVMAAQERPELMDALHHARMNTPDGMPLVWWLRRLGSPGQTRVYGPTLMWRLCEAANSTGTRVGLYGGSPEVLRLLAARLRRQFPHLLICYQFSPPFRPPTEEEDARVVSQISAARCELLFVGLGCPKQELWMNAHRDRVRAVMIGVGAAFDFHAGIVPQAPEFLQRTGMEWFFRLCMEPRRLWRRYLKYNPRFVVSSLRAHWRR